ncbi:TetR/AcrR family transcriptional regulator [Limnohabitans sp.]|uniref:TetR/AcrR family transcriptional regulator n=1 Tax=Limnohabitans sp. TaxID=1907725 RepID=UPI0035AE3631
MRIKTEARRHTILNAAAAVFLEKGYASTTMSDIADRAGGSKTTVYGYFPSKEELFLETIKTLAETHFSSIFGQLSPGDDLRATLRKFGRSVLQATTSDSGLALYRLMIAGAADPVLGKQMFSQGPALADQTVTAFLEDAVASGQLRLCDPSVAADHLRCLLESEYIHKRLLGAEQAPSRRQIAVAVDRAIDVFLAAYGPSIPTIAS